MQGAEIGAGGLSPPSPLTLTTVWGGPAEAEPRLAGCKCVAEPQLLLVVLQEVEGIRQRRPGYVISLD